MEYGQINQEESDQKPVVSPFSNAETSSRRRRRQGKSPVLWIILGVVGGIVLLGGVFFLAKTINDPLRTLEQFPVSRYFDNYKSLAGSRFRATLRVEADLGWKEGTGRLMLFATPEDSRPFSVMVPAAIAKDIYFTKGQAYAVEIEVREGGLIYGNSFKKG